MIKQLFILLSVIFLSVPLVDAKLSDVENSRNRVAIEYLNNNGVIGGYPDGSFRPLDTINRAELLKILVGGTGSKPILEDYNNCFPDVIGEWFAPFVCYAKEKGWVDGYPDGTFRPSNTVNTAEAIKMVVNSQGYIVPETVSEFLYDDVDRSEWFAPYVKVAKDKGILEQNNGNLGSDSETKRGGISEVIYRSMYIRENNMMRFTSSKSASSSSSKESSSSAISTIADCTEWTPCNYEGFTTRSCRYSKPREEYLGFDNWTENESERCSYDTYDYWKSIHDEMLQKGKEISLYSVGIAKSSGLAQLAQVENIFVLRLNEYISNNCNLAPRSGSLCIELGKTLNKLTDEFRNLPTLFY